MKKLLSFAVILAMTGCASLPDYIDQNTIANSYAAYLSQPLASLVRRIGPPTRNASVDGQNIYVWHGTSFAYNSMQTCNLEVYVDDGDVIQGFAVRGQNAACQQFMLQ